MQPTLQLGHSVPPPIAAGGGSINLTIDTGNGTPISLAIRVPEAPMRAVAQPTSYAGKMAESLFGYTTQNAHVAGTSVMLPNQYRDQPSTTLMLNQLFPTPTPQLEVAQARFTMHESIDTGMKQLATPAEQSTDQFRDALKAVHQVMAELVTGNMMMNVPPDEIRELQHTVMHKAMEQLKQGDPAKPFCAHTLKTTMKSHHKVKSFLQMHHPQHGHHTNMHYHPVTGVQSKTVLANHLHHDGKVEEHMHGQMVNHEPH